MARLEGGLDRPTLCPTLPPMPEAGWRDRCSRAVLHPRLGGPGLDGWTAPIGVSNPFSHRGIFRSRVSGLGCLDRLAPLAPSHPTPGNLVFGSQVEISNSYKWTAYYVTPWDLGIHKPSFDELHNIDSKWLKLNIHCARSEKISIACLLNLEAR